MFRIAPVLCVVALLAACSGSNEPAASAAQTPAAAAADAPAPAASEAPSVPADPTRLVRAQSPALGRATAPVTVVEFLDPACEACRAFAPVVKQIQFLYPDEVRVVLRFADFHPGSEAAIRILFAAQRQRRLEEVLAALFDHQEEWASHEAPSVDAAWKIAAAAGLDVKTARKDAASAEATARLKQEEEDLTALQVSRTPTFYVNGRLLENFGAEPLMNLVKAELGKAQKHAD